MNSDVTTPDGTRRTLGQRHLALARAEVAMAVGAPAEVLALVKERIAPRQAHRLEAVNRASARLN